MDGDRFPQKPNGRPWKTTRKDGANEWLLPSVQLLLAMLHNMMILMQIQAYNAFGTWWRLDRNLDQYRIPHRILDALVYPQAPGTISDIEGYTRPQWLQLAAFYRFDWATRTMRGGGAMTIQQMRAEWAVYCGITAFMDEDDIRGATLN